MAGSDSVGDRGRPEHPQLRQLALLSRWLDDIIRLPGGYRIGLDGIIGLIPGAGDAVGAVASSVLIGQAAQLGVPSGVLLKMLGNVLLDAFIGAIPILGDIFDFAWKANLKNFRLLERNIGQSSVGERGRKRLAYVIMALVALALLAVVGLVYLLLLMLADIF